MSTAPADSPWMAGRRAVGEVAFPAALVLGSAALLAVAYYHVPAVHAAMESVAAVRRANPLLFAVTSTSLTAGLIPWLLRMALPRLRPTHPWRDLRRSQGISPAVSEVDVTAKTSGLARRTAATDSIAACTAGTW